MPYHVRRKDKEITDARVLRKILKATKYVTIAMSKDNVPYLVSLSHGYDEGRNCLYFHCAPVGKKLDYIRSNNVVWGQALLDHGYAEGECDHLYASVHFKGTVSFVENPEEKRMAIECMMKQLDRKPGELIAGIDAERLKGTTIGRIDIEYMSGKKSKEVTL
ncbi:MAG: pyridoxamine 5'-phosphate oxidase family protein [Candidatus Brockarchaeota archaeon]|nr:pyridoxamine 5'-phosphate oxidase family protein [Candidatus Brockarchaeota archaeon]